MKTLLVPVDFTAASDNAVRFAAEWSIKYGYKRIILLKSFYTSMYESVIMSGEFANVDQEYLNKIREDEKDLLNTLCKWLDERTGDSIKIQTAVTELPLVRAIMEMVQCEDPAMILIGNDNIDISNEAVISGKIISIAKISTVRVLIVPAHCSYQPIQKMLVPCDFNAVDSINKLNHLRASALWDHVHLMVLNVDAKQRYLHPDEKFRIAEKSLHNYLQNFHHQIYYVSDKNVIKGILNFKEIDEVQMMIALPGQYSFLYSLTHKSISEALYRNTRLPVMILK